MFRMLAVALLLALAAPATATALPGVAVPTDVKVAESAGESRITVTLSEPSEQPFDVSWRTGPPVFLADAPSAVPGRDYVEASGTLQFAPGETRRELTVTILDDAVDDSSGYLAITYGGEPYRGPTTLLQILDDEPTPAASIGDVRVAESAGEAVIPVTRPAISLIGNAMYDWRPRAATATRADFASGGGVVGFGYGTAAAELKVPIVDDVVAERDERLEILLTPATSLPSPWGFFPGPVADGLATVTVVDDDPPRTVVSVTPLRGRVVLGGRRIETATEISPGGRVDARRGTARIAVARRGRTVRAATIAGGAVRLVDTATLAPVTSVIQVRATRGMRLRGERVTVRAVTRTARWTMADTPAGTRVRVRAGRVRAGGAVLPAGARRMFR